ncbi:hypothetical protein P9112_008755 [Eukaryota sp. TZLM1-RC]
MMRVLSLNPIAVLLLLVFVSITISTPIKVFSVNTDIPPVPTLSIDHFYDRLRAILKQDSEPSIPDPSYPPVPEDSKVPKEQEEPILTDSEEDKPDPEPPVDDPSPHDPDNDGHDVITDPVEEPTQEDRKKKEYEEDNDKEKETPPSPHEDVLSPPKTDSIKVLLGSKWLFVTLPKSQHSYVVAFSLDQGKTFEEEYLESSSFNYTTLPLALVTLKVRVVHKDTGESSAFSDSVQYTTLAPSPSSVSVSVDYHNDKPVISITWPCVEGAVGYVVSLFADSELIANYTTSECILVVEKGVDFPVNALLSVVVQSVSTSSEAGPSSERVSFEMDVPHVYSEDSGSSNSGMLTLAAVVFGVVLASLVSGFYVRNNRRRRQLVSRQYIVSVPLTPLDTPDDLEERAGAE